MAIINYKGDIERNLQEQVAENKRLILQHYNTTRTLELFDVRVIGVLDEWVEPTGTFNYGDAYFVGTEAPYSLYIFTRADSIHPNDYWLAIEDLIVQGPEGRPLTFDDLTEAQKEQLRGEPGVSPKWFVVDRTIGVSGPKDGDMVLQGSTGDVYQYEGDDLVLKTNIKGKDGRGIYWMNINSNGELVVQYDTGVSTNLGKVVGSPGRDGQPGRDGITTVVNIIAELPAGSDIGATYDPTAQEPNSAVIMPVDGTNHIFIVVDGIWTDAGPFSGGSSVYAGGEFQTTFDADTKQDKILAPTTYNRIPTFNDQGTITWFYKDETLGNVNVVGSGSVFATYRANTSTPNINDSNPRFLITSTPKQDFQCANKKYVDTAIANAHSNTEIYHLGVFGAKTDDVSTLPLYTIPLGPFGYESNIQLPCNLMVHDGTSYTNIPVPCYIQFTMTAPPMQDGTGYRFAWTIYESMSNATMVAGTGQGSMTETEISNAYFQIGSDHFYNEAYITIHCPHDTSWYFPTT